MEHFFPHLSPITFSGSWADLGRMYDSGSYVLLRLSVGHNEAERSIHFKWQ
jgi:hypothetical protein